MQKTILKENDLFVIFKAKGNIYLRRKADLMTAKHDSLEKAIGVMNFKSKQKENT